MFISVDSPPFSPSKWQCYMLRKSTIFRFKAIPNCKSILFGWSYSKFRRFCNQFLRFLSPFFVWLFHMEPYVFYPTERFPKNQWWTETYDFHIELLVYPTYPCIKFSSKDYVNQLSRSQSSFRPSPSEQLYEVRSHPWRMCQPECTTVPVLSLDAATSFLHNGIWPGNVWDSPWMGMVVGRMFFEWSEVMLSAESDISWYFWIFAFDLQMPIWLAVTKRNSSRGQNNLRFGIRDHLFNFQSTFDMIVPTWLEYSWNVLGLELWCREFFGRIWSIQSEYARCADAAQ